MNAVRWNSVFTVLMRCSQNVAVATPVSDTTGSSVSLGREWWGGDLYLTVDPNNSARVYVSYSDSQTGAPRTLHLRRSTDAGQTWSADLLTTASGQSGGELVSSGTIFGGAALIGLVNIVLLTAMATVGVFIYNLTTDLVGGVEVTLADRD